MPHSPRMVYQQGDHICTLFTTLEEQLAAAIEYVKGGLLRGERCLYVCGEHTCEDFRRALNLAGIDVDAEEKRGALILITKHDAHLKGGSFDPDKMINMLHQAVDDALKAGFAGLCAAGDMNWVLDEAPGTEKLAEYESRLNRFYASNNALGLCQYNRNTLPPEMLDHCIATHKHVRIEGPILLENPFYEEPEQAMSREANVNELDGKLRQFESPSAA
jgi:chemotaxis family two-component system sensor kinase Cph1